MNIAFDAYAIEIAKGSGVGNYTLNQLEHMIERAPENQYYYFNCVGDSDLTNDIKSENFHKHVYYMGPHSLLRQYDGPYSEVYGELVKGFIRKYRIDIFYITSPFAAENVLYEKCWFEECKVVATAWDIIPYVMRKQYLSNQSVYEWYMKCIDVLRWTDRQLAISNSVKEDMVNYLKFDPQKIDVIYGGVSKKYKKVKVGVKEKHLLYRKFDISSEYVLCCVSADWRKNVEGAIRAFSKLPENLVQNYQLVIAGRVLPEKFNEFSDLINSLHMKGRIVLTGYVSDDELVLLYNLAKIMMFPSLYEGFGLPVLESWACGTPVIASENSSLGEIVGDAGVLFNPKDSGDIARALEFALTKADLDKLLEQGEEKVKRFTWNYVAELSLRALNNVEKNTRKIHAVNKIAIVYIESDLGETWSYFPKLISDRYEIEVFADCKVDWPQNIKARPLLEIESGIRDFDRIIVVGVEAKTNKNRKIFPEDKTIWLVAEAGLEELLRAAFSLKPPENNLYYATQTKLSKFFVKEGEQNTIRVSKIITASKAVHSRIISESLAIPVYEIAPFSGDTILQNVGVDSLRDALIENIAFAIGDEKPWGIDKKWKDGNTLIEELGKHLKQENVTKEQISEFSSTLGMAFCTGPVKILPIVAKEKDGLEGKNLRVNLITSWNTKCGIAEFSRFYFESICKRIHITVFPNSDSDLVRDDENFVAGRFWERHGDIKDLAKELLDSEAKLVHIQYTEGYFDTKNLIKLLNLLKDEKKIIITCHNTAYLCLNHKRERDTLNFAHFVVHQAKDEDMLKDIGIEPSHIHRIPLGQPAFAKYEKQKVRNVLGIASADIVIGSYGFLLPHKGILETIKAIARLKEDFPSIRYIACCSLYPIEESKKYYNKCIGEIRRLGLEKNVCMITDFLAAEESAYILQACDVLVMAYGETQESASGAVRFCVAAGRPLVTTTQSIFKEYEECSIQIPNNSPESIADGVKVALEEGEHSERKNKIIEKIRESSWETVSAKYLELYTALAYKDN